MEIIGRKRERSILTRCEQSDKPEFVAVYGEEGLEKPFLSLSILIISSHLR